MSDAPKTVKKMQKMQLNTNPVTPAQRVRLWTGGNLSRNDGNKHQQREIPLHRKITNQHLKQLSLQNKSKTLQQRQRPGQRPHQRLNINRYLHSRLNLKPHTFFLLFLSVGVAATHEITIGDHAQSQQRQCQVHGIAVHQNVYGSRNGLCLYERGF